MPATATIGVNSYVTLAEAHEIAESRLFSQPWTGATEIAQVQSIITATALLNRMRWQGRTAAAGQPLAWPRVPERTFAGTAIAADIIPPIKAATVELAIHLLTTGEYGGGAPLMSRMLGDSMVMYHNHVSDEFPKHVRRLIEPYLSASSANVAEVQF